MKLHEKQMQNWLDRLEKACNNKDRSKVLELYDENIQSPFWVWNDVPQDMQDKLETLTDRGNAICYGY